MSTHAIEVIRIGDIEKHPNADTLGIIKIKGWSCCIRLADFRPGDLAIYIPPDYVVPDAPEYAFLQDHRRIRVRRFRGILSQGLVMPAPPGAAEGEDVMERLGITRYEPPLPIGFDTDNEPGPPGYFPKYDVESYQAWPEVLQHGEPIIATEKLHGANGRYVWTARRGEEPRMFVGSRTNWKKQDDHSPWWQALYQNPAIETFCRAHTGLALYGEVFGQVQDLKYGASRNAFLFAAFDVLDKDRWLNYDQARPLAEACGLRWTPEVFRGPFDAARLLDLAEQDSVWPGAAHEREGIVIRPEVERVHVELGRVCLKMVSNRYLGK